MHPEINEDKIFTNVDYTDKKIQKSEFAYCSFNACNFTKAILNNSDFMDCSFTGCNFSLAVVENTRLKNIKFIHCKLIGVDFSKCNDFLFAATYTNCQMDYCSFYGKKMKKTIFTDCTLKEVDFSEADLTSAIFNRCDLLDASFNRTNLEKADLRIAYNYALDPELNKIKKAKFSHDGIAGLLGKYGIEIE